MEARVDDEHEDIECRCRPPLAVLPTVGTLAKLSDFKMESLKVMTMQVYVTD